MALRAVTEQLDTARQQGTATAALRREQQRLERLVRACALRTRGNGGTGPGGIDVAELLDELGAAELIEIVDIDGLLFVLVCAAGKVRQFTAGRTADAARAADFARFALRRLARRTARGRPGQRAGRAGRVRLQARAERCSARPRGACAAAR